MAHGVTLFFFNPIPNRKEKYLIHNGRIIASVVNKMRNVIKKFGYIP